MGITSVAGFASALADRAVDAYRARAEAQVEQRRLGSAQVSMLVGASLAAVGMVVDVVALQLRMHLLQQALDEAIEAQDLPAAEQLRAQIVAVLQDPPASAKLLTTLAEYLPALVSEQRDQQGRVIEGTLV